MKITLKKKLLSVFLSLAMFLSLSSTYSANASDKIETKTTEEFSLSGDNLPVSLKEIIKEDSNNDLSSVRDDDELYSITYQNEDGSKSSKIFDIPIKYVNTDGKTQYIDTSIVKKSKSLDDYEYQNAANDFLTEFSKDAQTGIRITKDQKKVSMSILNESKEDMNSTKLPPKNINDESISLDLTTEKSDEIKNGVVTGSVNDQFVYPKAFGDKTSVKYTNTFRGIKQDIILDENPGINTFSFNLDTDSLIPILVENGKSIIIVEPNKDNNYENIDNDNIKFYIPSIYVYDSYILPEGMNSDTTENAYHHFTEDCYYELEKLGEGQYKLTLVISEEFLNDPHTVYPVTVDPTLSVMNTVSNIDDTYTTSATPSTNYYLSSYLRIGNNSVASDGNGSGLYYTYLRYYSLPTLPSGQVIDSAYLKLKLTPGQTTAKNAKISHIDSSWNGSQLTWNANNPSIGSTVDSNVSHNGCSYYNFTVTASINSWYNGVNANCGWRIEYSNTSDKDLTRLYSSDSGISSDIPNLTINYKSSTPTIPTRTIADGTYYIRNLNSGKYIDVFNNGTLNGTSIIQYSFNGAKNQQWKVKYESDGYYSLRPMHVSDQSKTIDMLSQTSANTNGTDAQIWVYNSTYQEQKFLIQYASGGGYQIGTKQSNGNKVLEVTNSSTTDGEVVQIWDYSTDRVNDNWIFEEVNFGCAWGFNGKNNGYETTYPQYYINCYLYALGITTKPTIQQDGLFMSLNDDVNMIAQKVITNVESRGRSIRIINGPTSSINSNEYRFCLRIRKNEDYHFWLQTNTGKWCDKPGWFYASKETGYVNPSTASWDIIDPNTGGVLVYNYYNSSTVYFAVTQ